MTAPSRRIPYVGAGADGCRRSAQVDLDERDTLDELNPRREVLAMSAHAWELEAELLELEVRVAGATGSPILDDLADIDIESGVSAFDGLPFCLIRANGARATLVGQLRPTELRGMALTWLEAAEAAESDAALAEMIRRGNPDLTADEATEAQVRALDFVRALRVELADRLEAADG